MIELNERIQRLRKIASPATFAKHASRGKWVPAPHLELLDRVFMETLYNRDMPRIIVCEMPPRHGKTEYFRWASAWYRGVFPSNRLISTSYEAYFAKQSGRRVRNILEEHGRDYFEIAVQRDNRSASEWSIEGHDEGSMQTAGAGGALTGKGANLLLVDDPIKNAEEARSLRQLDSLWDWWESTAYTRMEPGGIAVVIATRWHELDLSGRLIAGSESGTGERVTRIRLPALAEENDPLGRQPGQALWPMRFPTERLEQMKLGKSAYWWNALYQQRPTQHEGAEWPDEYFTDILTEHWPQAFDMAVAYLDPSKGKTDRSDYSALVFVGLSGGRLWVDANIKRRPVPVMVSDSFWFCHQRGVAAFGIESNSFQELLAPEIDRVTRELNVPPLPILLVENTVNKEVRINRLGPYLSRKQIRIRDNESGRLLLRQMKEHPIGDHDDGPDALEGAIRVMQQISHASVNREDECETAMV